MLLMRMGIGILILLVSMVSCGAPGSPAADQKGIETAVAATLRASQSTSPSTELVNETESAADISPTIPLPPAGPTGTLQIAYTDSGNVWWIDGPSPPVQLSSSGYAGEVLISDDGSLAAFVRNNWEEDVYEIRVVSTDGGPERVSLDQNDTDGLYPLDGAKHILPSQIEFIPGSHSLMFNTQATFEGPGLFKFDDLLMLDLDTDELTRVLPPGSGGDFTISPDGSKVALIKPTEIGFSASDGTNLQSGLVNYEPVITYSEFSFYPLVTWSPDSNVFIVVIPSADPFAQNPTGDVWRINTMDASSHLVGRIDGHTYFPQLSRNPVVPRSLARIAFLRNTDTPNISELYYANLDGSGEVAYESGNIKWDGWHENSEAFVFTTGTSQMFLGSTQAPSSALVEGIDLRWTDANAFLYLSGSHGDWTLMQGQLGAAPVPIVSPAGDFITYDFLKW